MCPENCLYTWHLSSATLVSTTTKSLTGFRSSSPSCNEIGQSRTTWLAPLKWLWPQCPGGRNRLSQFSDSCQRLWCSAYLPCDLKQSHDTDALGSRNNRRVPLSLVLLWPNNGLLSIYCKSSMKRARAGSSMVFQQLCHMVCGFSVPHFHHL